METKGRVSTVTAATPANLTAGTYTVTCTFFGTTTVTTTAKNTLTVVNVGAMSLTSISPSVSLVKSTVKLSITGTGFVNSPELACKYGNRKVPATFKSSTSIECDINKGLAARSMMSKVSLYFVASEMITDSKLSSTHSFALNVPTVSEATFSKRLSSVAVKFSKPGRLGSGVTCEELFPYNYTSFGTKSICFFKGVNLVIALIGSPSLGLGDLILNQTKVEARGAAVTLYPGSDEQSVTIKAPTGAKAPIVRIRGPKSVGK